MSEREVFFLLRNNKGKMAQNQLESPEYHLKPAERKEIICAAKSFRHRCLLKTLAHTAIMRAELAKLDVQDIDSERNLMEIHGGKGRKAPTVRMSEELASDPKCLVGPRKAGPIFMPQRNGPSTLRQVTWIVAQVGKTNDAKSPNLHYGSLTCHLFRHSFAKEWKKRGGSVETLSKIRGHISIKTALNEYETEDLT